jgi:hypothetical protein
MVDIWALKIDTELSCPFEIRLVLWPPRLGFATYLHIQAMRLQEAIFYDKFFRLGNHVVSSGKTSE